MTYGWNVKLKVCLLSRQFQEMHRIYIQLECLYVDCLSPHQRCQARRTNQNADSTEPKQVAPAHNHSTKNTLEIACTILCTMQRKLLHAVINGLWTYPPKYPKQKETSSLSHWLTASRDVL
eukprot:3353639-Amphidinium_carterae.1